MLPIASKWSCSDCALFTHTSLYWLWYLWLQLLGCMQIHSTDSLLKKKRFQSCVTRVRNESFYVPVMSIFLTASRALTTDRWLSRWLCASLGSKYFLQNIHETLEICTLFILFILENDSMLKHLYKVWTPLWPSETLVSEHLSVL